MMTPLIGITLDSEAPGGYSKFPWYALRENYCAAVARAGGLPLPLPHQPDLAGDYLDLIDGLVVTGGAFDVDPALFGADQKHATVKLKEARTRFELAMVRGALERDLPLLGICGGQQLLHVALGGTLIQHIPDAIPDALAHEQPNPRDQPGHAVDIRAGTLLRAIIGQARQAVNSAHHQAADEVPAGVVVNAIAPDGVIEGIETRGQTFCLGVQWHPEFEIADGDVRLFAAFVEAARRHHLDKARADG
jgi:putative glutamine amidotransferase